MAAHRKNIILLHHFSVDSNW